MLVGHCSTTLNTTKKYVSNELISQLLHFPGALQCGACSGARQCGALAGVQQLCLMSPPVAWLFAAVIVI